jgi:membrane protein DedA with SNARE-associated domain
MQQAFVSFVSAYGYAAVFLLIMLEDFGMPVPGETALVVAAGAAAMGDLNIWGVVIAAVAGAIVGDNIGYAIGRYGGRKLVLRLGDKVGITAARYAYAEGFFERYGDGIVMGARFVEVLRQLNGIIAGTLEMPWGRFLLFNSIGAILWVGAWAAVGYFAGEHVPQIHAFLRHFTLVAALAVLLTIVAVLVIRRRMRHTESGD